MIKARRFRHTGWSLAAMGLLLMCSYRAFPHHSFPATYVEGESTKIEGRIAAFMFRNPHSYVHVNVEDAAGGFVRYAVEWGAAASLGKDGIDRGTLKPGDFVIITGLPGRNTEDRRLLLRTIVRPSDAFRWGFEEGQVVE